MLPHKRSFEFARTSLLNYRNQDVIISPDWAANLPYPTNQSWTKCWGRLTWLPSSGSGILALGNAHMLEGLHLADSTSTPSSFSSLSLTATADIYIAQT